MNKKNAAGRKGKESERSYICIYMCRQVVLKIRRLNLNAIRSTLAYVKMKAEVI